MPLKAYFELVLGHRALVTLTFSAVLVLNLFFVIRQPWEYEGVGTFVVRPRTLEANEIVRAFDTLSRGQEILATYATIAESDLVMERARSRVDVGNSNMAVDARGVAGTNVIEVAVTGRNPELVYAFADAIGNETVRFVFDMQDAFVLERLDPPVIPDTPVGPNKALNVAAGLIYGAGLAIGLARFVEYAREARGWRTSYNILDPTSGAFNGEYFDLRLGEELSRIEGTDQVLTVGEIRVREWDDANQVPSAHRMRRHVEAISAALRPHDVLCATERGTLSVIFPDLPDWACRRLLDNWKFHFESATDGPPLKASTGVRTYRAGSQEPQKPAGTTSEAG